MTRFYARVPLKLGGLISQLKLPGLWPSILQSPHVTVILINEIQFFIDTFPWLMELRCFFFVNIVVMIGLLNVITSFFFDNFMSLIIKHSLFSDSFDSIVIFVGLLFLRDCLSIFVLTSRILEVALGIDFSVGSHCWTTYKSLADVRSLLTTPVSLLMH